MRRPFFSIIIPTYKRAYVLREVINIFLSQTFDDFEIVVVDDCSPDSTRAVVTSLKDKRIKYNRNSKNLGQEGNFKKAFGMGQGKYLFICGNDDYILWPDTLEKVYTIIKEKKYGFIRLNLIEKKFFGRGLRKSIINHEKDIIIPKNSKPEVIIEFFRTVAVGHMAGLIFKRGKEISKKMFDLQETPWIRILYEATYKDGATFLSKHYMIITWSQMAILHHYDVKEGKPIMIEQYTNYVLSLIPQQRRSDYKYKYYHSFVMLQPAIKLYSNNVNLIRFYKRLFQLEPRLKDNKLLWIMFAITLVTPKFIWNFVRAVQHNKKNYLRNIPNVKSIYNRFSYLESHYFK